MEDTYPISSPRWASNGEAIFYLRGKDQTSDLMKLPVDAATGEPEGDASVLMSGMQAGPYFSLTRDGTRLFYTREQSYSNLYLATIESIEQEQKITTQPLTKGTSTIYDASLSPDRQRIALSMGSGPTSNIFIMPIAGGPLNQLTFTDGLVENPVWRPDGTEIAFGPTRDGISSLYILNAEGGGTPRRFEQAEPSGSLDLTWSPGPQILYHQTGNRNYHILDSETGQEQPLIDNPEVGWIFTPRYSPDGPKVVGNWNRKPVGLWLISLEDGAQQLLRQGHMFPIGWSEDGQWIYAQEYGKSDILKISITDDQTDILATLPFENVVVIDISPDEKQFVVIVQEEASDVWMAENFDPAYVR